MKVSSVFPINIILLLLQLEKAKSQHARWQSLGKTNPDKKRLESEIEDECKSIAWQVRSSPVNLSLTAFTK